MALIQSGSVQSIISIHAKNGLTKLINDYQCYDIPGNIVDTDQLAECYKTTAEPKTIIDEMHY